MGAFSFCFMRSIFVLMEDIDEHDAYAYAKKGMLVGLRA